MQYPLGQGLRKHEHSNNTNPTAATGTVRKRAKRMDSKHKKEEMITMPTLAPLKR
jgi:hypothetical protein